MDTVLVANRGEIAVRIARTCAELDLRSVAVYSDADRHALHVRSADDARRLPGTAAARTYLDGDGLVEAALAAGADAVHPGYGFLAEDASFAAAVERAGLTWIGPSSGTIAVLGDKSRARALAESVGVPVLPARHDATADAVRALAADVGWPLVVKATAGGGGRGQRVVTGPEQIEPTMRAAAAEARAAFGDDTVHVERFLDGVRHVEVQILADGHGTVLALGDRDCSVQRRHQKLVEEAPAPGLPATLRADMAEAAVRLARHAGYLGAGTVEFLVEDDRFWFLEVNTRIQVEHPVTELVLGVDLVAEQLHIAAGRRLDPAGPGPARGHAIECRINAEDPVLGTPSPGTLTALEVPWRPGLRFDAGYGAGDDVPAHYDGLIGKLIAWGPDRAVAIHRLAAALSDMAVGGVRSTVPAGLAVLGHPDVVRGGVPTSWFDAVLGEGLPGSEGLGAAPDDTVAVAGRRYRIPRHRTSGRGTRRRRDRATTPAPSAQRRADGDGTEVRSPMSGTVTGVFVAAGDRVAADATLVTIESMKMEHPLRAPRTARVDGVLLAPGDDVGPGELIVRLHVDE